MGLRIAVRNSYVIHQMSYFSPYRSKRKLTILSLWTSPILDSTFGATIAALKLSQLFLFFVFLGPHLQHMEVPKLGVQSELQPLAYTTFHSNSGSELHPQPTPQLTATQDPQPTERGQELNPSPHGY